MCSLHNLVLLLLLANWSCAFGVTTRCAKIIPDSTTTIPVELGKEFTATCFLNDSKYNADNIEWLFGNVLVPKEYYTKINASAVSLSVNITSDMESPLRCKVKQSLSYQDPCGYGIFLKMGYPPVKPENLSCMAHQYADKVSPNMTCWWDPGSRDPIIKPVYTLYGKVTDEPLWTKSLNNTGVLSFVVFPHHMTVKVWVEVENDLGKVSSNILDEEAETFVKPDPPANVTVISEAVFPTSLVVKWKHPINSNYLKLKYNIRYCKAGASTWTEVPQNNTEAYIDSFRLQSLLPYTEYVVQVRSIHHEELGYWSSWSRNSSAVTPETKPSSKPRLWRFISSSKDDRLVRLVWKDPVKSNGKILGYNLSINENGVWHIYSNISSNEHTFRLPNSKMSLIGITARNKEGVSPRATLLIPLLGQELAAVESVECSAQDGQLLVKWQPHTHEHAAEYLLEWMPIQKKDDGVRNWQIEPGHARSANLQGNLVPFKLYSISVYPIYSSGRCINSSAKQLCNRQPGKAYTTAAFLQQGAPRYGPNISEWEPKKSSVTLRWDPIPLYEQQGFTTNYTIFYKSDSMKDFIGFDVGPNILSYTLNDLTSDSIYRVYIMAHTVGGSKSGTPLTFNTQKYEHGEIEAIVVAVCIGFLFLTVLTVLLCLNKREIIKKRLWPQVPDPSNSTIANWSPDFPTKADTPKEATPADLSVVEVDVFDGKSLCEDDKAVLPLKKDKYLSEEHSSGIGGSSCMSSPRQSVSDSDEGDSGQTTASTVQYSSVVASGYKGQTPGPQPPIFTRSESTQPLLDSEENLEQHADSRNSYFKRSRGLEAADQVQLQQLDGEGQNCKALSFCPMEEESIPTPSEPHPEAPAPSYMPQQNGYRPQ